jgi:hypothetical protein
VAHVGEGADPTVRRHLQLLVVNLGK